MIERKKTRSGSFHSSSFLVNDPFVHWPTSIVTMNYYSQAEATIFTDNSSWGLKNSVLASNV